MSDADSSEKIEWVTTAPLAYVEGRDTGAAWEITGWKLHAIQADGGKFIRAACGLIPAHGWSWDMFIEAKCARCVRALERSAK